MPDTVRFQCLTCGERFTTKILTQDEVEAASSARRPALPQVPSDGPAPRLVTPRRQRDQ